MRDTVGAVFTRTTIRRWRRAAPAAFYSLSPSESAGDLLASLLSWSHNDGAIPVLRIGRFCGTVGRKWRDAKI